MHLGFYLRISTLFCICGITKHLDGSASYGTLLNCCCSTITLSSVHCPVGVVPKADGLSSFYSIFDIISKTTALNLHFFDSSRIKTSGYKIKSFIVMQKGRGVLDSCKLDMWWTE